MLVAYPDRWGDATFLTRNGTEAAPHVFRQQFLNQYS
jgi:hypothetical protein